MLQDHECYQCYPSHFILPILLKLIFGVQRLSARMLNDARSLFASPWQEAAQSGDGPPRLELARADARASSLAQILFLMEAVKMLVLSRRTDSSVKIGPDVTVTVLSIQRKQVRLGIKAPKNVRVLRDELLDVEPAEDAPHADPDQHPRAAGMKIVLVIEDNPLHAQLIRKALCRNQGTMVTVAETAQLALDALGALAGGSEDVVQPDLILLDVALPDSSGLDVLRAIRSDDRMRATPVVMLTCCQDDAVINQCVDNGANAYVVKSPRWDEFRASVSRIGEFWTNEHLGPRSHASVHRRLDRQRLLRAKQVQSRAFVRR
jgi:carbon storage regulator CsrA